MAEHPMMPFWTDAYLGDTRHLTTIEHGAYLLLLITAWRSKDGKLPDDDELLARYCGLTKNKWKKMRPIISDFFTIENNFWVQSRLQDERKAKSDFSKSQSKKAKARHLKNKETDPATADIGQTLGSASPIPIPIPIPKDKDISKDISPKSVENAFDLYNELANDIGLAKAQILTDPRKNSIRARLKEIGGIEGWELVLEKIRDSDFLSGRKTDWKANIDFIISKNKFTKIMEGNYDNGTKPTKSERADAELQEFLDRSRD